MGQVHPPYKYKGPRPIETSNRSKTHQYITFLYVYCLYFYLQTLALPTPICCSSFVSATSEGILGGLSTLEQPYVRLPWRGLSRASVHRTSLFCTGEPVWPVTLTGLSIGVATVPSLAVRSSAFVCFPRIGANTVYYSREVRDSTRLLGAHNLCGKEYILLSITHYCIFTPWPKLNAQ